jgi:membrane associated rhomboid family serine protease
MTYLILILMWATFLMQFVIFPVFFRIPPGSLLWRSIFVLSPQQPLNVLTWVTSIFSHGSFVHIGINSIVLFFVGPVVERRLGRVHFVVLFLVSGIIAGLAQVGTTLVLNTGIQPGIVGSSGAIMGILGVLTLHRPNIKVYLFFLIPVPFWILIVGFAAFSTVAGFSSMGPGGVANWAHLVGLGIGITYATVFQKQHAL